MECDMYISIFILDFLFLWGFDPIQVYGLPLRDFAVTLVGHITLGRIPLDEWLAPCRNLYLTTHSKHSCPWRNSNPQS